MAGLVRKKRRWMRRVAAVLTVTLAVVVSVPFLFTTAIVRHFLASSDFVRFTPTVERATLSPSGVLTLTHFAMHEPELRDSQERPKALLMAEQVQIAFSWKRLFSRNLDDVQVEGLTVYVRPDTSPGTVVPVTLGRFVGDLLAAAKEETASPPIWIKDLHCRGAVNIAGFDRGSDRVLPLELRLHMEGERAAPSRRMSAEIGEATGKTRVTARVVAEPVRGGMRVEIQQFAGSGVHLVLPEQVALALRASWPESLRQELSADIENFEVAGTMENGGGAPRLQAKVKLERVSARNAATDEKRIALETMSFSGSLKATLDGSLVRSLAMDDGQTRFDSMSYAGNQVQSFSSTVAIKDGRMSASGVNFEFAGGKFAGNAVWDLEHNKLAEAALSVTHLNQKKVAANLSDRFDAEGSLSGTIKLARTEGQLDGKVELTSDGPGRLMIKDQQLSEAMVNTLRAELPEGAAPQLPPNFSDIIIGQLKNYPYLTGHVVLDTYKGQPMLTLDYKRKPLEPGEAGYGVPGTIAGQKVLQNFPLQLNDFMIALRGTLPDLLAMAAGLKRDLERTTPNHDATNDTRPREN